MRASTARSTFAPFFALVSNTCESIASANRCRYGVLRQHAGCARPSEYTNAMGGRLTVEGADTKKKGIWCALAAVKTNPKQVTHESHQDKIGSLVGFFPKLGLASCIAGRYVWLVGFSFCDKTAPVWRCVVLGRRDSLLDQLGQLRWLSGEVRYPF